MADSVNKLEKRVLGKSNLTVSRMCYGTLAFSVYHANVPVSKALELLIKAYDLGINFWDTAELYETYEHLKPAIKALNNDVVISSRSYARTYDEMMLSIEKCLKALDRYYIDIFGLHEVQKDEFDGNLFRAEAFRTLVDARQKGLIRAISITTHSAKVVDIAASIEDVDIIMPLINCKGIGIKDGNLADMEQAIKKAKGNNKGIYAMKVLAGGGLTQDVKKAFDYALQNPDIDSIAVGMDSMDELLFNIAAFIGQEISNLEEKLKSKKENFVCRTLVHWL